MRAPMIPGFSVVITCRPSSSFCQGQLLLIFFSRLFAFELRAACTDIFADYFSEDHASFFFISFRLPVHPTVSPRRLLLAPSSHVSCVFLRLAVFPNFNVRTFPPPPIGSTFGLFRPRRFPQVRQYASGVSEQLPRVYVVPLFPSSFFSDLFCFLYTF